MSEAERTAEETREFILATAQAHLRRYGYARLTVVEIARACGMSHANVYRFFESKAAIIDAVTKRWLVGTEQAMQKIASQPTSAATRLEAFVLELHRIKRAKLTTDKELFEAYSTILEEHRAVVEEHLMVLQNILEDILASGVHTKEFQIKDIQKAAIAVRQATWKFHHPLMVAEALAEPTEEQARIVVKLLVAALASGCV